MFQQQGNSWSKCNKRTLTTTAPISRHAHTAEECALALISAGANVNAACTQGRTALLFACQNNDIGSVTKLLAGKADPSVCTKKQAMTPVFACLGPNMQKCLQALFEAKADANHTAAGGETPIIMVREKGQIKCVCVCVCVCPACS